MPEPVLYQGNPSLCQSCGPLDNSSPVFIRRAVGSDLQKEGSHNGCLQLRLGGSVWGQPDIWLLVDPWATYQLHINCLEMMAVCLALKTFLTALKGHHSLVRLDKTTVIAYTNHQGSLRSHPLYRMARRLLGKLNQAHAFQGQCSSRRMEATIPVSSNYLVCLQQGWGGPLRLQR